MNPSGTEIVFLGGMTVLSGLRKDLFGPGACTVPTKVCVWGGGLRDTGGKPQPPCNSLRFSRSESLRPASPPGEGPAAPAAGLPQNQPGTSASSTAGPQRPNPVVGKTLEAGFSEAACLQCKGNRPGNPKMQPCPKHPGFLNSAGPRLGALQGTD